MCQFGLQPSFVMVIGSKVQMRASKWGT